MDRAYFIAFNEWCSCKYQAIGITVPGSLESQICRSQSKKKSHCSTIIASIEHRASNPHRPCQAQTNFFRIAPSTTRRFKQQIPNLVYGLKSVCQEAYAQGSRALFFASILGLDVLEVMDLKIFTSRLPFFLLILGQRPDLPCNNTRTTAFLMRDGEPSIPVAFPSSYHSPQFLYFYFRMEERNSLQGTVYYSRRLARRKAFEGELVTNQVSRCRKILLDSLGGDLPSSSNTLGRRKTMSSLILLFPHVVSTAVSHLSSSLARVQAS